MMRVFLTLLILCTVPVGAMAPPSPPQVGGEGGAVAQDTDGDGLSDALEAKLGMDQRRADTFELLHDDRSKADGDKTLGRDFELAADFTRISFCAAAKNRYVWKVESAAPWVARPDVATILYVDADNNRATGRQDAAWSQGVDLMLRPDGAQTFTWPGVVRTTSASEGNVLYLVADIVLHQEEGKSRYRCRLLTQNTAPGRQRDNDTMTPIEVTAAGCSPHPRVAVPPSHPLYYPPEVIAHVGARMVPDVPRPQPPQTPPTLGPGGAMAPPSPPQVGGEGGAKAEVTWITSWPCRGRVHFGTGDLAETVEQPDLAQNHRVFLPVTPGGRYRVRVACAGAEGEPRQSEVLSFRAEAPAPRGNVRRASISLTRLDGTPCPLPSVPFLAGVPFPRGALGSIANLRLLQGESEIPLQAECTARWPDGTVRWTLVQALAGPGKAPLSLEYGSAVRPTLKPPAPMVAEADGRLVCSTGPLRAVIDTQSFTLFRELSLDRNGDGLFSPDEQMLDPQTRGGLYLVDAAGKEYLPGKPDEVVIEENGPVRAVVKVRGRHTAGDGSRLFEYTVRLMFVRGESFVRFFHTFGNDHVAQPLTDVARMGIRIPLALGEGAEADGRRGSLELRQMRYEQAETVPDALLVSDGAKHVAAHLVDLREQYPKAWRFDGKTLDIQLCPKLDGKEYADADPVTSDRLYYYLRDGVYRFHSGVSKTHEIRLWLPRTRPSGEDLQALAAYRPEALFAPEARWVASSGAAGLITARSPDEYSEYEGLVERSFDAFLKLRDRQGEYGMLNFGDWWGERGFNWGNVEYDTQHVMLMHFLRTRDPRFLARGSEAAIHNRDVDGIHYAADPRQVGQVHVHTMFHTGGYEVRTPDKGLASPRGGFNRGHVWTRGYLDHYFLTGDRRSLEWALAVADHLAGPFTLGFSVGNHAERDTAWPLFGVLAAYEATADPYYLNAARIIVEDVVRRQNPETGNWGFPAGYSKVTPQPIGGYAWCCGLLISSLDLYGRYVRDPRVEQVIVRAARWLVRDEWIREKQGFRATSCPSFNASTPAGGASWSCSNALLIAHRITRDKEFLDIARRGYALFLRGTQAMGKGVTQSICLGPETLWRFRQLGITSLDALPYLPGGTASVPRWVVVGEDGKAALTITLRGSRAEKMPAEAQVSVSRGLAVQPPSRNAEVAGAGQDVSLSFEIAGGEGMRPGETRDAVVEWKLGPTSGKQAVKLVRPEPCGVGDRVGLVASGDDFLGPALDRLGTACERVKSLAEIGRYRVLLLGTQAHSIDSAGLRDGYWMLFPWVRAGGTLLLTQLNDTGWEPGFLPYPVVVEETDGESGAIAEPGHPIFAGAHQVAAAAGVKMYDTLRLAPGDPWKVLMRDSEGGPAVVEAPLGKGRILLMQPSFEREPPGTPGWKLFENLIGCAVR